MSKLIGLAALVSLFAILACSRDDSTPAPTVAIQPTTEATATATPVPTATSQPTVTVTSQTDSSEPARGLAPLNMDDPQAFLSALSTQEQSCLAAANHGVIQIATALSSTDGSAEGDTILDCLADETALRVFLSEPLTATGELSDETSSCIRESLDGLYLHSMMKSTGAAARATDAQIVGIAGFLAFAACLNGEEWEAAAPVLELGPRDKSGTDCLLAELGGPTGVAEALLRTDESGLPADLIAAAEKCGVDFIGVSESMPEESGSDGIDGQSSTEDIELSPDMLRPVAVNDPETFISELSAKEQSCFGDRGIGPRELLQLTGHSPGGLPGTTTDIVNCMKDDTVLRLFLTTLVGQVEPFSEKTSYCIREGFLTLNLRGLLAPAVAGFTPADSLALSMAALNVSVACMNDDEWETHAPRLGMQPEDRESAACLFEELGGPAGLVEAMKNASFGEAPEDLNKAFAACGLESGDTESTATPGPATVGQQPHIMLRVVLVTEDWMPFSWAGGWTRAVPEKESATLRYYEAAIWEETDSVHLYAFPNDYDPFYGLNRGAADEEVIAYREQYALSVHTGMPEESSDERSDFLRNVFEDFAEALVERHPEAEHHLMYDGHGGPGGDLFAGQLKNPDADSFLASWTELLGKPLGVIDMGGPCNKGGYDDLANFCKHARYYVASDLTNGGYDMDDWTAEKYYETDAETQYHRLLASNDTLEETLAERINLRRQRYEYSRNNQTTNRVAQASYVYSCAAFSEFSAAFEAFLDETTIAYPTNDLYTLLQGYSAPSSLLTKFQNVIVHAIDNRDFFVGTGWHWNRNIPANGIITPVNRIYREDASG